MTTFDTGTAKLTVTVDDGIATLTFDNPAKRNALSLEIRTALPGALRHLDENPDVRVVVVTGAGDQAFVSGADISEFGDMRTSAEARANYDRMAAETAAAWQGLGKPTIAAIRGFCMGGGLLTALQTDIRFAAEGSQFGVPAARLGLGYGAAGVALLAGLVGPGNAAEILFSARRLTAAEALRMGLVNRVVPAAELHAEVMALAGAIRDNAPLTVAAIKASLRELRRPEAERDHAVVAHMVEACFRSEDYQEGQRAFAEKRPPRFRGV
jgi:enoyl-CoA hydratase/carnithine racemase